MLQNEIDNNLKCLNLIKNKYDLKNVKYEYVLNNRQDDEGETGLSINLNPNQTNVELWSPETARHHTGFRVKFQQFTYDPHNETLTITGFDSKPKGEKCTVHLYFQK